MLSSYETSNYLTRNVPAVEQPKLEFLSLVDLAGIDLGAMVDPGTELSFAVACRVCGTCPSKVKCRQVLRDSKAPLSAVASFCPSADVLVDLMYRQPGSGFKQARAA
jgi:hypothetical protein